MMPEFCKASGMTGSILSFSLLLASGLEQAIDTFFDPTFAGIHQLAWFDWALLIPYFAVLIVLSVYGLHRYEMIRGYLKHRKKLHEGPAKALERAAPRTIQLPLYNEKLCSRAAARRNAQDATTQGAAADPGAGRFDR